MGAARGLGVPGFPNQYLDGSVGVATGKDRRPDPQKHPRVKVAAGLLERPRGERVGRFGFRSNPFRAVFPTAVSPSLKPVEQRRHPAGRGVLRRNEIAQQDSV